MKYKKNLKKCTILLSRRSDMKGEKEEKDKHILAACGSGGAGSRSRKTKSRSRKTKSRSRKLKSRSHKTKSRSHITIVSVCRQYMFFFVFFLPRLFFFLHVTLAAPYNSKLI